MFTMRSDMICERFIALLFIFLVLDGGSSAPVPDRAEEELKLLFDPNLIEQYSNAIDYYGERPFPPPLPPYDENPYEPNLEEEYY